MIIGITGFNGAGKTTVVDYLQKKSFASYSLSDLLREMVKREGKETTRENLIEKGNALREQHGNGILAQMVLQRLQDGVHYVIDSIRNPGEVEALNTRKDFVLIAVEAPMEVRLERLLERKGDKLSYEQILAFEKQELENEDEHKQRLSDVRRMASIVLKNDRDLDILYKKIDKMLIDLFKKYGNGARPSWDTYFMNIAKTVATRSNCMKRKVAAIIVKDKRIISTGYNGTPRGTTNCNEGGCPRCNSFSEGGTKIAECLCSHGEENAIVQGGYHGTSLKDSTLYTTFSPCLICAKMIINAGIQEVVFNAEYPLSDVSFALLKEAEVEIRQHML